MQWRAESQPAPEVHAQGWQSLPERQQTGSAGVRSRAQLFRFSAVLKEYQLCHLCLLSPLQHPLLSGKGDPQIARISGFVKVQAESLTWNSCSTRVKVPSTISSRGPLSSSVLNSYLRVRMRSATSPPCRD